MKNKSNQQNTQLKKNLKIKHIIMMTIGSSIGTGLFISLGNAINQYGAILITFSYILIGIMVYSLINIIGELTTFLPTSKSFTNYASKYVEAGFGFSLGWNYWYNWALTITINLISAQIIMNYWYPTIPSWIWGLTFLCIIFFINFLSTKNLGEIEYWLSLIKILAIIAFLFIGGHVIINIVQQNKTLINWKIIKNDFYRNNIYTFIKTMMIVGFAFQGIELITITAKEIKNPKKYIPKIINRTFSIIQILYTLVIAIIIIITNQKHNFFIETNNVKNVLTSPFTIIFQNSKFINVASIMNFIILIAILSSSNAGLYASTRMLYTLAIEGKAPKKFKKLSKNGIPRNSLYITTLISGCYLINYKMNIQKFYIELINISSITGFISWLGIIITHYRFRKSFKRLDDKINKLSYKCKYFPIGTYFSFILCSIITLGQAYVTLSSNDIKPKEIIITYIGIPLFIINWLIYKIIFKNTIIKYNNIKFYNKKSKNNKKQKK